MAYSGSPLPSSDFPINRRGYDRDAVDGFVRSIQSRLSDLEGQVQRLINENGQLRHDLSGWAHEVLLDPGTLARGWFREDAVRGMLARHADGADVEAPGLWSLLMLELWQREIVDVRAMPSQALKSA